jgi:DNA recombination protein RmuC
LSLLAGLLLGGTACAFTLRARAAAEFERGRGESGVQRATLSAELTAANQREAELKLRLDQTQDELESMRQLLAKSQQIQAALDANLKQERAQSAEKLTLLAEARETLSNQFKALANDILEEKARRFTEQNRENLGTLLSPLHERIQAFSKQVQDTYDKDSKERLTLEQELKNLQALNTRLNQDAVALTNALTGANNKAQGNWGEMVLERVLETSGLQKDREYRVQVSDIVTGEEGTKRYQPDVIIDLPEGKQLVIDSKVSLNAYVRYTSAEDEATRAAELKGHIAALRAHIRTLSEKRYQDLYRLNTLDFVFMFVPVEPAYLMAVQHDMSLFNEAFERRIMIVGPSTLLATLRTVASIWRYEYQNQNAQEIARQSGAMYDKFVGFVETLEKMGKQVEGVRDSWQDAMKKLRDGRGNLIGSAEKLRQLGIKSNKQLGAHLLGDAAEDPDDQTP